MKQGREGSVLKMLKLARLSKTKASTNLKSEDGKKLISSLEDKLVRWKNHFEAEAKPHGPIDTKNFDMLMPPTTKMDDEEAGKLSKPFSEAELFYALKQCKLETASGIDSISSNMLQIGAEVMASWLKVITDSIWKTETIPKDWQRQIIIPIHKKGSVSLYQNYRRISFLCVASKVFGRAVLNRIQKVVEKHLDDNQCGFRPSRGCVDQIFSVKILMQRAKEFNKPIHLCFVDLQKAYDTVNRDALWEILSRSFNITKKLIWITKTLHSGTTGLVRSDGKMSEEFPIRVGVKQGDVLALMLFNMFLDAVIKVALKDHPNKGIHVEYSFNAPLVYNSRHKLENSKIVQKLVYADDIMLTSSNIESFQCFVNSVSSTFVKFGLKINLNKTSISPDYTNPNNDIQWNDTKYCNNNKFFKEKVDDIDHGQS